MQGVTVKSASMIAILIYFIFHTLLLGSYPKVASDSSSRCSAEMLSFTFQCNFTFVSYKIIGIIINVCFYRAGIK